MKKTITFLFITTFLIFSSFSEDSVKNYNSKDSHNYFKEDLLQLREVGSILEFERIQKKREFNYKEKILNNLESKAREQSLLQQRIIIYSLFIGFILILIVLIVLFRMYRKEAKLHIKLKKQNEELKKSSKFQNPGLT